MGRGRGGGMGVRKAGGGVPRKKLPDDKDMSARQKDQEQKSQ